jgi:hypothetical protein
MDMDIQIINHNYIQRLLIFSVFLYKRYKGQPDIYYYHIQGFLDKKLPFKVDYTMDIPLLSLEDRRDLSLNSILGEVETSYIVTIHFKTGYQSSTIYVDLSKEVEYEKYLKN